MTTLLRRAESIARIATVFSLSLSVLPAQSTPDGATLLMNSAHALDKFHSYEYTERMTIESAMPNMPSMPATVTVVQGLNPGKIRRESKAGAMATLTMVNDGQQMWMYSPMMKRYTKMPEDSDQWKGLAGDMDALNAVDSVSNAKVLRSEIVEIAGEPHDCWVVEHRADKVGDGVGLQNAVFTDWIDKALGIQLQSTTSGKVTVPGEAAAEMNTKTVIVSLKLNPELAESLFVFTPPEGATESAELFPTIRNLAPEPKAAVAKPPAFGEPQAFVPDLNPIRRVRAVYPEAARSKGLQGMVELLVTVDTQGNAIRVEALSGTAILRPAAIDAVKQWRFLPVLRNGKPVDAYTEVMVPFFDDSKPAKNAEDMGIDIEGSMAGARRIAELKAKFPRSPEQVLADTEQNVSGANAQGRVVQLPQLAKAALDAGALEKATDYANEMLQSATDSKDWNYGNAIHDGNMVLGLVALRQNDVGQAKQDLLNAGHTPGSPQLDSFGPDFRLARELARRGESETVLEYFQLCRTFWKMGGDRLDAMTAAVQSGRDF